MDVKDVIETFHNSSHEGLHALIEYLELEDNQSKLYNYFNSFSNYDLKTQKSNRVFADIVGKIISEDSPEDEDTKGAEDTLKVITQ